MHTMRWPFPGAYFMAGWGAGCGPRARGQRGRPWWAEMMGQAPRPERGEVRYVVLDAIADRPRHGYEIIQSIAERTRGRYRPSPGVVYPTLQLLEEVGHARASEDGGRKVYAITAPGKEDLASHRDEVEEFYERFASDPWDDYAGEIGEVAERVRRLLRLFGQAARRGRITPRALRRIRQVLDEAAQQVERILRERQP